jgi:probable rRNA maturation factor
MADSTDTTRSIYVAPWRVDITTRPTTPRLLPAAALARLTAAALVAARAPSPASIGLILTGDGELARLNFRHMGHEGPTDVLSFPLVDARSADFKLPPGSRVHLGDVVVSVERAIDQAEQGKGGQTSDVTWSPADELRLLVVHGTLHICGWDHAQPEEEGAMRALENKILGTPA